MSSRERQRYRDTRPFCRRKVNSCLPPHIYCCKLLAISRFCYRNLKRWITLLYCHFHFYVIFKGKQFENSVEERESYKEETRYDGCSGFKQQITTERLRVVPILRYSLPQKTVARGNIPTTSLAGGEFGGVVYLVKRRHQPSKPAPLLLRQNGLSSRKWSSYRLSHAENIKSLQLKFIICEQNT